MAESTGAKRKRVTETVNRLKNIYPEAECALKYEGEPWKLLVMGRLSAQCTDERVNKVCEKLFELFPTARAMADGNIEDIENAVRSCGLYKTKAANIKDSCRLLCEKYNGILPDDIDTLLEFPGVGRKIANLLVGDIYGKPAIVADTHCMRLSVRMGFCPPEKKTPENVEKILSGLVPKEEQSDFCHRLVFFGREYCPARSQICEKCPLNDICPKIDEKNEK